MLSLAIKLSESGEQTHILIKSSSPLNRYAQKRASFFLVEKPSVHVVILFQREDIYGFVGCDVVQRE